MTLRDLLTRHGLGAYADAFEAHHVPVSDLPQLSDEDLRSDFGMTSYVDRKRFRGLVAEVEGGAGAVAPATPPVPTLAASSGASGASGASQSSSGDPGATRIDPAGAPTPARVVTDAGATRIDPGAVSTPAGVADPGATRIDALGALPQRIGMYRVLGLVGAGGMGTVVRARHVTEDWAARQGGDVAIKIVHAHLAADAGFRERFFAEAELGRRVTHASLVPTWDVVEEGGWLGTVMSLVEGEPLTTRVRAGGLPVGDVVALLGPIAEALDHLHANGIVHRDLKPANILVRPDGRAVLLDLGIAKDTRAAEQHTRTMTSMGTSAWMAPEQADAKHVDGAADRYALGLVAYALLAGRLPWDADASEARVLVVKLTGALAPLDTVRAGLPAHVGPAVMKMLALAAGERFGTCGGFVGALGREQAGEESLTQRNRDTETKLDGGTRGAVATLESRVLRAAAPLDEDALRERAKVEARAKLDAEERKREVERAAKAERDRVEAEKKARAARERQIRKEAEGAARAELEAERRAKADAERKAREAVERAAAEKAAAAEAARKKAEAARAEAERVAMERACPTATPAHAARTERLRYACEVERDVERTVSVPVEVMREFVVSGGFLGLIGRKTEQRVVVEQQKKTERVRERGEVRFEMVVIPPCSFMMGDETQHPVRLTRAYAMATTPVTQELWMAVMGANPAKFQSGADAAKRPVEQVSWFDAVRFCNALSAKQGLRDAYTIGAGDKPDINVEWNADGFRLPTEAEWECAARAGTSHVYAGGDDLDAVAWHSDNSGSTTQAVGRKRANTWGLHDLSGNVWEWCQDVYGDYSSGVATDPRGAASGPLRVYRGGSWNRTAGDARAACRGWFFPGSRGGHLGLRLSRTIPSPSNT